MSAQKRSQETADPDYADAGEQRVKRQRLVEQDAKETVSRKIQNIVQSEFQREISHKETELQNIDKKLNDALLQMDRLRACIVAAYYGQRHQSSSSSTQAASLNAPPPSIHPAVRKHLGKAPKGQSATKPDGYSQASTLTTESHERLRENQQDQIIPQAASHTPTDAHKISTAVPSGDMTLPSLSSERRSRFKIKKKIIVGNVSKYIPVDSREANDMSSHKWMVYVRGPKKDPDISGFVRKVWFFLHHSYKPNDLVEVSSPPFHLTRRGWGEFPVRVQLHFVDSRNKKLDIIHHLKLDKTLTGLQTLGAETVVEVEVHPEGPVAGHSSSSGSTQPSTSRQANSTPQASSPSLDLSTPSASLTTDNDIPCDQNIDEPKHPNSQSVTSNKPPIRGLLAKPAAESCVNETDSDNDEEMVSLSGCLEALKKEILQSYGREEQVMNLGNTNEDQEYHMTIAHEQAAPPQVKKIKEEPDQDVDVCADDDHKRGTTRPVVKAKPINFSYNSATVKLEEINMCNLKEEPMDTSYSLLQSSTISSIITPSNSCMDISSKNTSLISSESSAVPSPHLIQQNLISTSQANNLQASPSFEEEPNGNQPVKLTIIKDPFKLISHSGQMSSSAAAVKILDSSTSSATCVTTTTATTTTSTTQISSGSIPSLSSSISFQPTLVTRTSADTATKPLHAVIQQQEQTQGGLSKLVVIKPNPNLPIKVVNRMTSSQISNPVTRTPTVAAVANSPGQVISAGQALLRPPGSQVYKPLVIGGSGQPMVISSAPTTQAQGLKTKPKSSRQVSLLTGLVVNNKLPAAPTAVPSASVLANRSIPSHQTATGATSSNISAIARLPQTPPLVMLNKASSQSHNVVVSNPSVIPSVNLTNTTQGGRTLIKVLNKGQMSLKTPHPNSPITLLSMPKTIDTNLQPVSVQTLLAQSPHVSLNSDSVRIAASTVGLEPVPATSTSSPQVMLSFPNGKAMPLPQDLETCHFPKMSAVGITKHGKGYRSALNAQAGVKKSASHEDRLRGQYEVLRAFKENPELYQKKAKKVILATNDAIEGEEDIIPKLQLKDYPNLRSLTKAAVLLHPLVQPDVNRITHPYCAISLEEWDSWPIGKQRAAEWHRASCSLTYMRSCLAGLSEFKGEQLLSTRQLMDWCRLRAFSPALPVTPRRPGRKRDGAESKTVTGVEPESPFDTVGRPQVQSLTLLDGVHPLLLNSNAEELRDDKERVNVVDEEILLRSVERETSDAEVGEETGDGDGWLPPSPGATFVYDQLRKRGVRLQPQKLESSVMACLPAEIIYRLMTEFCSDVLRESLAMCEHHSSRELTSQDVVLGLTSLPEATFCCNKYLGKQDEQKMELTASR